MRMNFFAISALAPEQSALELEAFISSHRVLAIDRHLVQDGSASYWAVCVTYQQSAPGTAKTSKRGRVDYREILSEQDFALFARLRDLRKSLAQREAVPPYAIFTNEQLAAIATERPTNAKGLSAIAGVGPARVDKYGDAVLEIVRAAPPPLTTKPEETNP